MSEALIAALFLNFSGAVAFHTTMIGRHNYSVLTHKLAGPVITIGTLAAFAGLFLFIRDQGSSSGLVYFGVSGLVYGLANSWLMDGIRSVLGLSAAAIGGLLALHAIFF